MIKVIYVSYIWFLLFLVYIISQEHKMGWYVTGAHVPLFHAFRAEAVESPGRDIVLGVGDINFLGDGIDRHTIGHRDFLLGAIGNEMVRH